MTDKPTIAVGGIGDAIPEWEEERSAGRDRRSLLGPGVNVFCVRITCPQLAPRPVDVNVTSSQLARGQCAPAVKY